jgi:hypothetical protein
MHTRLPSDLVRSVLMHRSHAITSQIYNCFVPSARLFFCLCVRQILQEGDSQVNIWVTFVRPYHASAS